MHLSTRPALSVALCLRHWTACTGQRHSTCPATVPPGVPLQVDDSYGTKSHAEFMTGYGFLPTIKVDEYSIDLLSLLQDRLDFPEDRLRALVRTGGSGVLEALQKVSAACAAPAIPGKRCIPCTKSLTG